MIRLLVADDHPVVRRGLRDLFEEFGMTVVAEAATADEVIALAPVTPLDAVVLDLSMPGATGLEVVRRLAGDCPRVPVLVLSIHPEDQIAIAALKAGAAGYLAKSSAPEELVAAIHTIVAGGRYIGQRLAEQLLREAREPVSLPLERLWNWMPNCAARSLPTSAISASRCTWARRASSWSITARSEL